MSSANSSASKKAIPLGGAAPYQGGKRLLAKTIIEHIEKIPHTCYVEPFVGMGGVFFRRSTIPTVEVINDSNREIATFFRVLQRHYHSFLEMLRFQLPCRTEFERLRSTDPSTLTDLERAARLYYVLRMCYGGRFRSPVFGFTTKEPSRFNIHRLAFDIEEFHERLSGVIIECLPYHECIQKYDRPTTLFYLDPPYYGSEHDYGKDLFSREDFTRLAQLLGTLQGNFILSLNDHPAVRTIFADFEIRDVSTTYSVRGGEDAKRVKEVLIFRKISTPGLSSFSDEGIVDTGGCFDDSLA